MTKQELINHIAGEADITKVQAEAALHAITGFTQARLAEGNDVTLPGIGSLKLDVRAARTGRNPRTGESVEVPAKNVVKFKAAKALNDAIA